MVNKKLVEIINIIFKDEYLHFLLPLEPAPLVQTPELLQPFHSLSILSAFAVGDGKRVWDLYLISACKKTNLGHYQLKPPRNHHSFVITF